MRKPRTETTEPRMEDGRSPEYGSSILDPRSSILYPLFSPFTFYLWPDPSSYHLLILSSGHLLRSRCAPPILCRLTQSPISGTVSGGLRPYPAIQAPITRAIESAGGAMPPLTEHIIQ